MFSRPFVLYSALLGLSASGIARADDVKFYEQNGVTYQETHQVVQRPLSETHYQDQQRTVYVEQYKTQNQPVQQTFQTPVTVYTMETYWVNRWNPFSEPYQAYRYVPHTHWETRVQTVQVPTVVREIVPQQQTIKTPVTTQRVVAEEHISRVPVAMRPGTSTDPFAQGATTVTQSPLSTTPVAQSTVVQSTVAGGTPLDSDPPRQSTAWHAADGSVQR
jgi:hypothetical protein